MMTKSAEQVLWESVPDLFVQWLASRPDYERLHKAASGLPGLETVPHVVYCLPHEDLLHVGADVGLEKASQWSDMLRREGIRCVTMPGAIAPLCYGYEPWMLVKQAADPRLTRPRYRMDSFAGPYPLAAALAGSVMHCGTGGFTEKQAEYLDTPLHEALEAAKALLGPAPANLVKAASFLRSSAMLLPIRPADFSARVWAEPSFDIMTKAAASGLVAAAAYGRDRVLPSDLTRVAIGLGATHLEGRSAGYALVKAAAAPDQDWAPVVARSIALAFGLGPRS